MKYRTTLKYLLLVVVSGWMWQGSPAQGRSFDPIYEPPVGTGEGLAHELLLKSRRVEAVLRSLEQSFQLPNPVVVRFGHGKGPMYDPSRVEIRFSYQFIHDVANRLGRENPNVSPATLEASTLDVVEWVLYHELAHALVDIYNLPVLGREEDAADALATLLALEMVEEGGWLTLSAAKLFILKTEEKDRSEKEYWDDHSQNRQRYSQVLCWVYGSNPQQFHILSVHDGIPPSRIGQCPREYALMADGWWRLLEDHLKP